MIFDELVLHNFGVYRGEHRVTLTPQSDRPIILFGALNGSGKTTFMEGMQLALYGKGARPSSRGRLAYHEYLARSINRHAPASDGAGLQFAFRHRTAGRDESIRLIRTWSPIGKGLKETFEVWRDEVLDLVATERWAEFVEDFIPIQISDLFFFDGEKIEGLADPEQSAALLKVGLHSLLGLDLVDHLVRSLGVIERRKKTAQLSAPDRAVVDQLEGQIVTLEQQVADLAQRDAGINNEIDQCARKLDALERELETSGGKLLVRRKELEEEYRNLKNQQAIIGGQLIEASAGDAPLVLVTRLLDELEEAIRATVAGTVESDVYAFILKRDKQVLKKLAEIRASKRHIEAIRTLLQQTKPTRRGGNGRSPSVAVAQGKLFSRSERNTLGVELEEKITAYDAIAAQIEACERNLAAVPQEDAVKATVEALEKARQERERLAMKKELLAEEHRKVEGELARKRTQRQSKLEQLAGEILSVNTTHRILRHSVRVRATLGRYRDEIAKSHMLRLEGHVTECFRQLHRKKMLKHSISIDRDTYELRLLEDGAKRISASELSAGERQLLAVSVLWALAQASGRKLPTVIDTPLGRLDSAHRHYLVQNYFPKASHQVILFSTDEEIMDNYYQQLKPAIALEYSILFDESKRSSVVCPGYFSKEALAA